MRNFLDFSNCAAMAHFELIEVSFELNSLKKELASKATATAETASLELGELCELYVNVLSRYEHLYTMAAIHAKQTATKPLVQVKQL